MRHESLAATCELSNYNINIVSQLTYLNSRIVQQSTALIFFENYLKANNLSLLPCESIISDTNRSVTYAIVATINYCIIVALVNERLFMVRNEAGLLVTISSN